MKWLKFAAFLAATLFCVLRANADAVTYTYAGAPMVSAPGAIGLQYNCATCTISGSFTVGSPLAPTDSIFDKQAIDPISYSFTATGLGRFNEHNSAITLYASVLPSEAIGTFYFQISGPLGFIYSNFYGSAFEFTDYYTSPNGKRVIYAEGNYPASPWTMPVPAVNVNSNITLSSDPVPTSEPAALAFLVAALALGAILGPYPVGKALRLLSIRKA
jgi:hypothetical protein